MDRSGLEGASLSTPSRLILFPPAQGGENSCAWGERKAFKKENTTIPEYTFVYRVRVPGTFSWGFEFPKTWGKFVSGIC